MSDSDVYIPDEDINLQRLKAVAEDRRTQLRRLNDGEDSVNHPAHYGGDTVYEVIKVAEAWGLDKDAYLFNAIKYIARCDAKDTQLVNLKKAAFYLNRRIESMERDAKTNAAVQS